MYSISMSGMILTNPYNGAAEHNIDLRLYRVASTDDRPPDVKPIVPLWRSKAFEPCPHVICLAANMQAALKAWTLDPIYLVPSDAGVFR